MSSPLRATMAPLFPRLHSQAETSQVSTSGSGPTRDWRLRQLFVDYIVPIHLPESPANTLKEYFATLSKWEKATDATIGELDGNDFVIGTFRRWLVDFRLPNGDPLADRTRAKHLGNLQFIISRAGPQWDRSIPTLNLIQPPAIPKPRVEVGDVEDCWTLTEIAMLLEACEFATTPRSLGLSACAWWRCLVLFAYNTGLRIGTLRKLRWDWEDRDELGLWLKIPAHAMKMKRGFKCHVNAHAEAILQRLRSLPGELIFPWPYSDGYLQKRRVRLLERSQIPTQRHFGFHALRKACATELGMISSVAAEMQMAHAGKNVTRDSYTHRRLLVEKHKQLPRPPWHGDINGRQRLLFA